MKVIHCILLKLTILLFMCESATSQGLPFLHPIFSDNMVLQRDEPVPVWGWTTPNTAVTVTLNGQTKTATSGADGRWQVEVGPFSVGGPYALSVTGPASKTVAGIMMGDVFLCAGQSNIEWTVKSFANSATEIADSANYSRIRAYTVKDAASLEEKKVPTGTWQIAGPSTTGDFSATSYYFAKQLAWRLNRINPNLSVPIGIVVSAVGGTRIESWLDRGSLINREDYKKMYFDEDVKAPTFQGVSQCYNARIAPLIPFKFKAVVWYQGESNSDRIGVWLYQRGEQYQEVLPLLRNKWRTLFNKPNLPFIIVQIATPTAASAVGLDPAGNTRFNDSKWSKVREAQEKVVVSDPLSALVTTIDIAHAQDGGSNIHPYNKQDVGKRISIAALKLIYNRNSPHQGPIFTGATKIGNTLVCSFTNIGEGLIVGSAPTPTQALFRIQAIPGGVLTGFTIAGSDGQFKEANAIIGAAGNTVIVSHPTIPDPKWVRYAWADYPKCNLYCKITDVGAADALAAGSFRNDPYNCINVNSGNGSGYAEIGGSRNISAPLLSGQSFIGWAGDTNLILNPLVANTSVNLGKMFVSVRAKYNVTAAPTGFTVIPHAGTMELKWNSMTGVHYKIERATQNNGPYTVLTNKLLEGASSYIDDSLIPNVTYYYRISAFNLDHAGPVSATASATSIGMPSPWVTLDIGGPTPGSASYMSPIYTLAGSGVDIWGNSDQFRYLHQPASGDCSVVAKLVSMDNTNVWAKAGVMLRESTAAGSSHAAVFVTPGSGISFQWRSANGGACNYTLMSNSVPRWVKITRTGNIFSAFYSLDGQAWTPFGVPQTIVMAGSITAGLAVTSHDAAKICTAKFDNVAVIP